MAVSRGSLAVVHGNVSEINTILDQVRRELDEAWRHREGIGAKIKYGADGTTYTDSNGTIIHGFGAV